MPKIQHLKQRLANNETIIMDGAMGTEILHRGLQTTLPLWSAEALLQQPELVQHIHEDYIRAGAEIIITDTFRTTRRAFTKKGLAEQATAMTRLACEQAHQAVANTQPAHEVYIAGSVAPLEDCYSPELTPPPEEVAEEQNELISDLKSGGIDFLLFETMITLRETLSGIHIARKHALPFAVSFCCNEQGQLLSGEPLSEVVSQIAAFEPLFIGINCISVAIADKLVKHLGSLTDLPMSVYAQGDGVTDDNQGWHFSDEHRHETAYLQAAERWRQNGTQIIGGCCGTTPADIQSLAEFFHS